MSDAKVKHTLIVDQETLRTMAQAHIKTLTGRNVNIEDIDVKFVLPDDELDTARARVSKLDNNSEILTVVFPGTTEKRF